MRQRIASLTSTVLNPFIVGLAAILVLSFEATTTVADALRWSAVMAAVSLLPVLSAVVYRVRRGRQQGVLTASRRQRTGLYMLAIACAGSGYAILHYAGSPLLLRAAFAGGFGGTIIFTAVNLAWKISLHVAFMAALATILSILYGGVGAAAIVSVVLVGWSRLALRQHSPAQVVAGALLASVLVVVVFRLFGVA